MAKTLKRTLSQRKPKLYEDIHFSCTIRFLDDSDPLTVTYQKEHKGQWLIDHVCKELNLEEKDYFGLRYVDTEKQRHWLDPLKPVYKQIKLVNPPVLCFRVKFYPTEPAKLKEELTRYFLFLQLKRDLHHGRLLCLLQDANLLAAYIIQSECGDYDPEEHQPGYVSKHKMLPKQTAKQEEKIAELHKTLMSQTPADAEANFITKAASLDTYGVDPHPVKDQKGNQMYLGVTHLGIVTFQGNKRTHLFKWAQVSKIAFEGKMFIVHVTISEYLDLNWSNPQIEDAENSALIKKKKHACGFKCATFSACKHLWKCAKEQQYFFTLDRSTEAPKVTSGGGFFSRGTKFRFSGRCQKEVFLESSKINRIEPRFIRSTSNPSIVRSYNKSRCESLPSKLKDRSLNDSTDDTTDRSAPALVNKKEYVEEHIHSTPKQVSTDSSMQSLTHGEIDLETPNGSVTKEIEHSLPKENPVQVSDKPYEPMRSPSREDLPPRLIDSITEGDSELDIKSIKVDDPVKNLETELSDVQVRAPPSPSEMLPQEVLLVADTPLTSQVTSTVPPLDITDSIDQPNDDDHTSVMTNQPQASSTPTSSNQPETLQPVLEAVAPNNQPSEDSPVAAPQEQQQPSTQMYEQGLKCCKILTWTFLLMFTVMSIVAIFVLESELDMPVLRDIRQMPEVQDFKHQHYNPLKNTAAQKMGKWFK